MNGKASERVARKICKKNLQENLHSKHRLKKVSLTL